VKSILKGVFLCEVETCARPPVDLYETADELVCEVDLPGMDLSKVSLKVYEDLLIIEGVRVEGNDEPGPHRIRFLCMERSMKRFRRIVKIPISVNTLAGRASYADGVLTITFPNLKDKLIRIKIERE
jgi:HSP20 family protein